MRRNVFFMGLTATAASCASKASGIHGLSKSEALRMASRLVALPIHIDHHDFHYFTLLQSLHPAGFVVFSARASDPTEIARVIKGVKTAGTPAFVAFDEEGGDVERIRTAPELPSAMAVGASDSSSIAEQFGACLAAAILEAGGDTSLGPVLDVASPESPLGTRSISDDAARVRRIGAAITRGIRASGCRVVLKHFPGYTPSTSNPEREVVSVRHSNAVLAQSRYIYTAFVGLADAVMIASADYESVYTDGPCLFSGSFLMSTRALMGGRCALLSDAIDMGAIISRFSAEAAAVTAIIAGIDCILVSDAETALHVVDRIAQALYNGTITEQRYQDALSHLSDFGAARLVATNPPPSVTSTAKRIAANSIAATGPAASAVAIREGAPLTLYVPQAQSISETLRDSAVSDIATQLFRTEDMQIAASAAELPYVVYRNTMFILADRRVDDIRHLRLVAASFGNSVRVLSCADPYNALNLASYPGLFSFGASPYQIEAMSRILSGDGNVKGRLPVHFSRSLSGVAADA